MIDDDKIECPGCRKLFSPSDLTRYYDRHRIYSGRACSDECSKVLPGQGEMWAYEAEEPIEADS